MSDKFLECKLEYHFTFNKSSMEKVLLKRYEKNRYDETFTNSIEYQLPETVSSIIGIEEIKIDKIITFNDKNIMIVATKLIDIYNNPIIIKFKLVYQEDHNNEIDVKFHMKVNIELLPNIILLLIQPIFYYIVENIFIKERELEKDIYDNIST